MLQKALFLSKTLANPLKQVTIKRHSFPIHIEVQRYYPIN